MTLYAYDTEFLENGHTIDLISIGIVADDGREYYAVSSEFNENRVKAHPWLMENVWPHLPRYGTPDDEWVDINQPEVKSRATIAAEVRDFLLAGPSCHLWAYFGAYDHIALAQLFGPMIDLPEGIPMWTHDLNQLAEALGVSAWPKQDGVAHNALEDARWVMACLRAARAYQEGHFTDIRGDDGKLRTLSADEYLATGER